MDEEQIQKVMEAQGGDLTDEQMAAVLDGNFEMETGDTDGAKPTPDPAKEGDQSNDSAQEGQETSTDADSAGKEKKADDSAEDEQDPVIIAKDGKHTIPYEKLVDARDEVKAAKELVTHYQDVVGEKDKLIEAMKKEGEAEGQGEAEASAGAEERADTLLNDLEELLEDYPEAGKQIKNLMESNRSLADKINILEKTLGSQASDKHFSVISGKHSDFSTVFNSDEYVQWVESQPSFLQEAYKNVYENGTAEQVVELLDTYKKATAGDTAAEESGGGDAQAETGKVADKIAKKIKEAEEQDIAPGSLSDIPGGAAHHDEGEAMREMSALSLMDKFDGKTQEQIEELLAKAL